MEINVEPCYETIAKYELYINIGDYKPASKMTLIINFRGTQDPVAIIEDVWTHENCRKKGIATQLIKKAIELAKEYRCYKIILDCADHNVSFYKKFGFEIWQNSMKLPLL